LHHGRTLFEAGDCASCHARPGQNDPEKLGGGLALESPMGTFYVPNISPDPDDGIGRWTEKNFASALLEGTSPDGRHYYPAFPYPSFRHMTLGDVRDLFAFIKSLPAVSGRIRPHELAFPFSIRRPLALWKFVFLDREALKLDPGQSKLWNRGAYLVNGPAHCAECHSPRNFFWALKNSQRFAGGPSI